MFGGLLNVGFHSVAGEKSGQRTTSKCRTTIRNQNSLSSDSLSGCEATSLGQL